MQCTANTKSGSQCRNPAIDGLCFCFIHRPEPDTNSLRAEFETLKPVAERFAEAIEEQLITILTNHEMTLGVPIERRVKSWNSIEDKLQRHSLKLKTLAELPDFVGLRLILLFKRDVDRIHSILTSTFDVISHDDTSTRLEDTQFGYQSLHYVIQIPPNWLDVPTLSEFRGLQVEIQVRTVAQHIWAAASHKLQYKQEASVPPPLRRSIHRISAILEIVDLEFERMLTDRKLYLEHLASVPSANTVLDVDVLKHILRNIWPLRNQAEVARSEDYSSLLRELNEHNITTAEQLTKVIEQNKKAALRNDEQRVAAVIKKISRGISPPNCTVRGWAERGAFYNLVGLTRIALELHDPEYRRHAEH